MLQILSTTLPIFGLIAIGFAAVRSNLVPREFLAGIGRFVLYFAMPALIFKNLSQTRFQDNVEPHFLTAYGVGSVLCFIILFLFFRLVRKNDVTESGLKGFGAALPNSIFIGYPVLVQALDSSAQLAFTMALLIENLVIFPLALIVMDAGSADRQSKAKLLQGIVLQLVKNPILIAIFSGFVMSMINTELPAPVEKIITMLAQASPAAALFFIGGILVGTTVKGSMTSIISVGIGKLILHPILVASCIFLLPDFDPQLQKAAILLAASPMLAIFPIIGARYGHGALSASMLLITTVSSFVTISTVLWLLP